MIPFPRLGAIIVLVVIVLALPAPAQACGCSPVVAVPGQSRPISFDREVAIFSATVVEQSLLKGTVTLDVLQVWKGELTYLTTMQTIGFDGSATSCDWVFELGKTYLIFGYGDNQMAQQFHDLAGWVMLPVAMVMLVMVLRTIRWLEFPVTQLRLASQ